MAKSRAARAGSVCLSIVIAAALSTTLAGCSYLFDGFCEGSVRSDVILSEVQRRFPGAESVEIDHSDCDSGGSPVVRFSLKGGLPEARRAFSADPTCRVDEDDPKEPTWGCKGQNGTIYYSYGKTGSALSR